MRILIVTHNYPINAAERRNAGIFVHDFARELVKSGVDVNVFCPSSSINKSEVEGIPLRWFKWGSKKKSLKELKLWKPFDLFETTVFLIKGMQSSLKYAREVEPDLCISMWAVPSGVFTYIINKKLGIPYCVWVLGSDIYVYSRIPLVGQLIRSILRSAKFLFSDGIDLAHQVKKISGKKCFFLQSGTRFSPSKKQIKRDSANTILTFVGRMESEKGPDLLVDALLELDEKTCKTLKVNFLGDGSLLRQLKKRVQKSKLNSITSFYGNVDSPNRIFDIISQSDWLIIPSRSDSIPLVFSEAMKAETPVIASALYDLKFLVNRYKVGILFKPEDKKALSKIIRTLPSQKKRNLLSKNTKEVADFFNLNLTAKRFLKIIYG